MHVSACEHLEACLDMAQVSVCVPLHVRLVAACMSAVGMLGCLPFPNNVWSQCSGTCHLTWFVGRT